MCVRGSGQSLTVKKVYGRSCSKRSTAPNSCIVVSMKFSHLLPPGLPAYVGPICDLNIAHCSACCGVIMNALLMRVRCGLPLVRCNDGDGDGGSAKAGASIADDASVNSAMADIFILASLESRRARAGRAIAGSFAIPAPSCSVFRAGARGVADS